MGEAARRVENVAQTTEQAGLDAQDQINETIGKANERLTELE